MCGILGLYRPGGGFDAREAGSRLEKAARLLAHRGPDASGVSTLPEHGLGFAHRRLAILDLDPRSNQPMASADGRILLTFNGEIYNFRELRDELEKEGSEFRTESDSEVLIEGYRRWGMEKLLSRIAGMFAFGLYDAQARRLFLVRDRAGKKPLYYSENAEGLQFASELRGLLRLSGAPKEIDPVGLDAYLALKFTPPPRTLLKGVFKLPPGCYLQKDGAERPLVNRYWRPGARGLAGPSGPEESLRLLDARLETAMRRRMVSDVPVCLFLSGGIDSSLMAAYLTRLGFKGMTAYTIGYEDLPGYNEFEFARLAAKRFPVKHEELILKSGEALEVLEDDALALDEPVSDWVWVPLYHLSRRAHQDGFKVVLVGEGSDELFFGYDVMMKGLKDINRFEKPLWRAWARAVVGMMAPVYRLASQGHQRYDLLRRVCEGEPVYMGSSLGWPKSQRHQVAGPQLLAKGDAEAARVFIESLGLAFREGAPDPRDAVNLISAIEFQTKMSEVLLQRVDRVTMLHSLEARSPFLDHELAELAFSIPGEWKIGAYAGSAGRLKGMLKDLARKSLPPEIVDRKKMGFSFPFKEWLRGELGSHVEEAFRKSRLFSDGWVNGEFARGLLAQHRAGSRDHAPRVWALYDLCRWYERWVVR